jgi:hypothetical protein
MVLIEIDGCLRLKNNLFPAARAMDIDASAGCSVVV